MNKLISRKSPSYSVGSSGMRHRAMVTDANPSKRFAWACLAFSLLLILGLFFNNNFNVTSVPFQAVMFLTCLMPFFYMGANPRHRLLALFLACYYLIFVLPSYLDLVFGFEVGFTLGSRLKYDFTAGFFNKGDLVVVLGAWSFFAGYLLYDSFSSNKPSKILVRDWKRSAIFKIALISWAIGLIFSVTYSMNVSPTRLPSHVLGLPLSIASNLRLFTPLAAIMLIYLVVRGDYRPRLILWIFSAMLIIEFVYGFVVNSKEISFRVPALLLLGLYFMRGSINKKIIIISLLVVIPYLLLFNAYRQDVLQGDINKTQGEALASLDKTIDTITKSVSKIDDAALNSLRSLKTRINGRIYVDIIIAGTDSGNVERLKGESLTLIFKTFIPRKFWAEKPQASIGQRFNNEFQLSESKFTFVPVTGLGELYWNFGMPGVIFGMMTLGCLFSLIASICLGSHITLARFMVVLLATYFLALRFEANFAVQYSQFLRLVILLFIANFFIKKTSPRRVAYK